MDKDFLLHSETAKELFHNHAEKLPIVDFHNHLNQHAILNDDTFNNIAEVWLGGDHYKWRAMRADGFSEELITGNRTGGREQFDAWAQTVQDCFGNPLYHWTHLELQRYFGVTEPLTPSSADRIWETCNSQLGPKGYSVRTLLEKQNVAVLCTTDDPADDLASHIALKASDCKFKVLPTFRPEKALGIDKADYADYIARLSKVSGVEICCADSLFAALEKRLDFFAANGCRVTDHSLESSFFVPATAAEVNDIFRKKMAGGELSVVECAKFRGAMLTRLGKAYAQRDLVMQIHIGAIRNNSKRLFAKMGPDHGLDSVHDFNYADELSALLSAMDETDELPRTILYYLNPKDADMMAAMAGNFQSNEKGIKGKVQLGTAWWFCDHKLGMEHQMDALRSAGLISTFVGMLTDSRSFLSFPRHEYFRRILCDYIGTLVEKGEYPKDMEYLGKMVENICYYNAMNYFGF
ncbi:MAG: glucuronate isomerase [Treponemataceae bacterium]|nr:glucuronate isomerase [Treponemataceae bacterium]